MSFTKIRVKTLRVSRGVPAYQPPVDTPPDDDEIVVSITKAEQLLAVNRTTLYRWLRDGFIQGEQLAVEGPWHIRITDEVRQRIVPDVPDGWVGLDQAAAALGDARQTVLHKVQRGDLEAVHVNHGRRKGLINVNRDNPGLFDTPR